MFFDLFLIPLFYWFIIIPVVGFILIFNVERGNVAFTTILVILGLCILQFFTNVQPFTYILNNPMNVLIGLVAYFAAGCVYVYAKWYSFLRRKYEEFRDLKYDYDCLIKVSNNKERIFGWLFYWPLSAAWTVLNDPIRRIFNFVYSHISGSLQRMSDRMYAEMKKGIIEDVKSDMKK
ncbi:hypothetical protein UFOVP787_213 [uncultured Caudovirales phage]|uniref:Uncharacterized protein n=1 Tax=uncultured Caudovirales phage TaxID=2100421 RepID=A0A6J5P635_9CAUD|nr:hypothetical protein UFOVP787_213 [uncultured Caudovirales phage]